METEEKKILLKSYLDAVQNSDIKNFMIQCIATIPNYWFKAPASSSGKFHPKYALGEGGLMRHTLGILQFVNRLRENNMYKSQFTEREFDLICVACLMHDSRKCGDDEDYKKSQCTRFDHPLLAAEVVRSIKTTYISDEEKEFVATAVETHMGQWNTKDSITLPLPLTNHQKFVHLVDYIASMRNCNMEL